MNGSGNSIPCSLPSLKHFIIQAMFRPRVPIVCIPSRSSFCSLGIIPCVSFQYCDETIGTFETAMTRVNNNCSRLDSTFSLEISKEYMAHERYDLLTLACIIERYPSKFLSLFNLTKFIDIYHSCFFYKSFCKKIQLALIQDGKFRF